MSSGEDFGGKLRGALFHCGDWKPVFFRLRDPQAREALERLVETTPGLQVFDTLRDQLRDLIRTRSPRQKLSDEQVQRLVEEHIGDAPDVYGAWVYYPWTRRLVHLLDEAEFVELRTNRNLYKITPDEQASLAGKRLGVVGLSVGQTVATTLALERSFGEIRLADFDRLDLSNLNRIRSSVYNLGIEKVVITAREIAELDPYLKVTVYPAGITDENIDDFMLVGGRLDLVIDECDSIDIKLRLRHHARRHRIPVVMETSDRGLIDIERFDYEPGRPIFHGLLGDVSPEGLRGLSTEEKVPYVMKIIGENTISTRLKASFIEIENTIKTWPQLASSVVCGGGAAADIARRMVLGMIQDSGRYYVDIEQLVPNIRKSSETSSGQYVLGPPEPSTAELAAEAAATLQASPAPAGAQELPREQVRELVELATAAPSGGNCQPWRFLYHDRVLFLFHDRARSESLADFQGLGGVAAIGAATENLALAARQRGLEPEIRVLPSASHPDLVASVSFRGGAAAPSEVEAELAAAILQRHTNRRNAAREPMRDDQRAALLAAVASVPGAGLQLLDAPAQLDEIGQLIGAGDRIRFLHEQLSHEMFRELRWTASEAAESRDGIFVDQLELTPTDRAGLEVCRHWPSLELVRALGGGQGLEKSARRAVQSASAVGLLTIRGTGPADYFQGGRAMQRLWLTAQVRGVALYPMATMPYLFARLIRGDGVGLGEATARELAALRVRYEKLFTVARDESEVLLFRLALVGEPKLRSLRRPLAEVLHFA